MYRVSLGSTMSYMLHMKEAEANWLLRFKSFPLWLSVQRNQSRLDMQISVLTVVH